MIPTLLLIIQTALAVFIQHYFERWFFVFCFASVLANLYVVYYGLVQRFCVVNDEIVLRFLASEMKAGITEDDLKAAYEKRLALVGPEEEKRIRKRSYWSRL
jgi:ABC-type arginine/histidine transport system permease subunit